MIIEKRSYYGYNLSTSTTDSKYKTNVVPFLDFLASLCEWDSVGTRTSTQTFTWGNVTVTAGVFAGIVSGFNNLGLKVTINGATYTTYVDGSVNQYLNIVTIKTATSVGIIIDKGTQNATITADYSNSSPLRFVLTKMLNLSSNEEEKGVVLAKGTGTAGEHTIHTSSINNTTATASTANLYTNAAVTILQPVTSATFTGYCLHVFVPVYQTCESSNSKATLNGANYYIMGGSLYLLDD